MPPAGFTHPSDFIKGQIKALHEEGISNREIARRIGCNEATVRRNLKKLSTQGSMARIQTPRIRKTTAAEDRLIVLTAVRNPKYTAREIAIAALGHVRAAEVSDDLIRDRLAEKGIGAYVIAEKPLLTAAHRRARVAFARAHKHFTIEDWKRVLWSDESKFNLFAPDSGKLKVYRRKGERLKPECTRSTIKFGGGHVIVWGCFSYDGVGQLHQIDGIMDRYVYRDILSEVMVPSAYQLFGDRDFIFQQDNDPKHTAKVVKTWLKKPRYTLTRMQGKRKVKLSIGKLELLKWPAQSPDLNPIENLWHILGCRRKKQEVKATSKESLMRILQDAWQDLPEGHLVHLVESMPNRCKEVIKAKGWHIAY